MTDTTATLDPHDLRPRHDALVERAEALQTLLAADAPEADGARRLTERSVQAMTTAGLFRLMTPTRFGGHGADMRTLLDVSVALGRGCTSAGWIAGVLNAGAFVVSLFAQDAQEEVWGADPDARAALVLGLPASDVRRVDGGFRVSGSWGYVSGSAHADWVSALVVVDAGTAAAQVRFALMPRAEVEVHDTWHFVGMRGTGSNTVVAADVFVPDHRTVPFDPFLDGRGDLLAGPSHRYRDSLTGLFSIGLIGTQIGAAQAAVELVRVKAPTRPVAGASFANQAESPMCQLDLARAALQVESALLHARRIAEVVDEHAAAGTIPDLTVKARNRWESTHVAQLCREALDTLVTAYGSSAFNEAFPLQRIWRDVNVGSRHAGFGMGVPQLVYGRALLGGDPRDVSRLV